MQEKSAQYDTIGGRIREFCNSKYKSVNDFSDAMMMDAGNVQAYLRGARKPGAKVLSRLESLGCNTSWVLTGKGEMLSGKQPLNADGEPVQQLLNVEETKAEYRMDGPYLMPAIGPQMTPEHIKEGDRLLIDPKATPEAGDFILTHTPGGPAIEKFSPGKPLIGVVVKLLRERPILRQ